MRKVIDVNEGFFDIISSVNALKTIKGSARKKLIQDILYFQRKCINLLRKLQMMPEGVEDDEIRDMIKEISNLSKEIEEEAKKF